MAIINDKDLIDEDDFREVKKECNEQLKNLKARLRVVPNKSTKIKSLGDLIEIMAERFGNTLQFYKDQDIMTKRKIIGSMYTENLYYDGRLH